MRIPIVLVMAGLAAQAIPAAAQGETAAAIDGTRLEVVATGESRQAPDIVSINAGVVTEAQTAQTAIQQNARRMQAVLAALRGAGIAERDIRTASLNLSPRYDYQNQQEPRLIGYSASNQLAIRFRDIERTGPIIDALVAQGVNQINGPSLGIENPDEALDAARRDALTTARHRADLYASALGMRVARVVSISENGAASPPMPVAFRVRAEAADASTQIVPGEQALNVTLSVVYILE